MRATSHRPSICISAALVSGLMPMGRTVTARTPTSGASIICIDRHHGVAKRLTERRNELDPERHENSTNCTVARPTARAPADVAAERPAMTGLAAGLQPTAVVLQRADRLDAVPGAVRTGARRTARCRKATGRAADRRRHHRQRARLGDQLVRALPRALQGPALVPRYPATLERATRWYHRYGRWSLLLPGCRSSATR